MSSYVGARIQIETREGKYEGILHSIDPVTKMISIKQATALPSGQKFLGLLNFYGQEIVELRVVEENELPQVSRNSNEQKDTEVPKARSYEDPENPEIFDDYQQGYQQVNSYTDDWGHDPGPPYSEEVIIPQEPEDNRPEVYSSDVSDQAVCEGISDLSLNTRSPLRQPQQSPSPSRRDDATTESNQRNYILISQHDAVFDQAITDMEQQSAIGLVLKGSRLGRKGKLSLVLVLCDEQVYMFDVLTVPSLFTRKFIDILQATDITKVIHDCRFVSDLLYHHYGIELNSVFDTQVGDILIKRRQYMGEFPRNVSGTTQCILEYLEISIHDIALHLENTQHIEEDESSWFQRPLPKVHIRCALLDTVYLLRLREAITEQLMAEVTCAIDIYLTVERDRLEVDPKKLSSRASYVPREMINDLHRRVTQMGMSNTRVKPKELSFPLPSLANPSRDQGQSPPKGPSGRGVSLEKWSIDASRGFQKTSPGRSAKPSRHEPPRPPLMMGVTNTEGEEESIEEVSSVSSEDSDEAFADSTEKELWQQRYSKNIKPVTLKEALTVKEENDDMVPGYQGATGAIPDHLKLMHQQPKSSTAKHTVPFRTVPNSTSVSGPNGIIETDKTTHKSSTEHNTSLRLTQSSSRSADMTEHSYSQQPGSVAPPKLTDLQQGSAVPKKLTNMHQPDANQRHHSREQGMVSGQASYADALSGKKKEEEELKVKAKRTLKAIGKALAAGENFSEDVQEDKDDGASRIDPHNGFDGYSSYGQGYSGFNCQNKHESEKASSDQGLVRTTGRGRASLFNQQSQVLNARQSQLQNRAPGGLGMRRHGGFRTVQVDFPTAEEIESAPDSVPIAVGSSFLSQRAI